MATINDFKVKDEDFNDLDIMSLPSRPSAAGMSAAQLQERFDAGSKQVIRPKLNALIDLLNGTEGADNIGITPIEGLSGYTVQQILLAIKLLLDDKKSIESADREIGQKFDAAEAQALVKEITFSEGSGVFTITKYDGSVQTYDTALEKVALDVRLDGQQFVLTLADGSEQRVDLSAFITQTEVKSSDTITLAIENGAIVARITSGSVMLSHLNAEVTAYIEEKEQSAKNSADAAKVSEQNALNSANAAEQSNQAARVCQEQACSCATQAGLSRDAAKASEQAAKEYAQEAKDYSGGDFVTNTAFNQFKETVPTLDDGKVSVQQGGLYINSETTEEDKAEAKEALVSLGMASLSNHIIKTFCDVKEIGLTKGSETIEDIASKLPPFSMLQMTINSETNNTIYPNSGYGQLFVRKGVDATRTFFEHYSKDTGFWYYGWYNGSWSGWIECGNPAGYLPLDGSVPMSGNVEIRGNTYPAFKAVAQSAKRMASLEYHGSMGYLQIVNSDFENSNANRASLFLREETNELSNLLVVQQKVENSYKDYRVHHEGNKPSGSYTGNGSSTSRTVNTNGIGKVLCIVSSNGHGIVTPAGGTFFGKNQSATYTHFNSDKIKYDSGVLTIASTDTFLNGNSVSYGYHEL